jgi:predicted PurR-regulated permease PerM
MTADGTPAIGDRVAPVAAVGRAARIPAFPRLRLPSSAGAVAAAIVIAVLAILVEVGEVLPVFVIALLMAYILDPVVTWMTRRGVPRGLATLVAIGALIAALAALVELFVRTIVSQGAAFVASLPAAFEALRDSVTSSGLSPAAQGDLLAFLDDIAAGAMGFDLTALIAPFVGGLVGMLGTFFTLLVLPFFLFYVLADRPGLVGAVRMGIPSPWRSDVLTVLRIVLDSFGTYVRAEAVIMAIVGILTTLGLLLLSLVVDPRLAQMALFLGLMAAVSELIPNFGPWIAAIPAVLFALTLGPAPLAAVIVLYLIVMFLEGQVLVPKIEGKSFAIHPSLVLVLVVIGVALLGLLGAVLALPVAAAGWGVARYVFRRAAGLSAAEAARGIALPSDPDPEADPTPAAALPAGGVPEPEGAA